MAAAGGGQTGGNDGGNCPGSGDRLRVVEFFQSIQGESTRQGQQCGFVRLAGCDLSCIYCDTPQAHDPEAGEDMAMAEAAERLLAMPVDVLEITGGEPLLQRPMVDRLAESLLDAGRVVMIETSGAASVAGLDPRLEIIMDVKTPGSGMAGRMVEDNLPLLDGNDELKFVITSRDDYDWAVRYVADHDVSALRAVHFSPDMGRLSAGELAGWLHAERPPWVRLTIQLHKLLGVA